MSNATDILIEAEEMIRGTFSKTDDQEISMQIGHWLLGFNSIENRFRVKCYSTKVPDINFCVDQGGDCESERVLTWFFRIRSNQMIFRPIKLNAPYLKLGTSTGSNYVYILPKDSKKLDLDIIKKHIFESYLLLLNKLRLVSNVSSTNNASHQTSPQPHDNGNLPCKEDVDAAELQVRKTISGEVIDLDAVLDQVKTDFERAGKSIKENWREITKQNIPIWFGKNTGGPDAA